MSRQFSRTCLLPVRTLILSLLLALGVQAAEPAPPARDDAVVPADVAKRVKKSIDSGLGFLQRAWLARKKDTPEGQPTSWGHPGIDALALAAFFRSPRHYTIEDGPFIREPFEYLISIQREDGAINDQEGLDNYVTAVALMALLESGEDVTAVREKAVAYLTGAQLDEGEGYRSEDKHYGGQGYGSSQRPDLSNTQLAVEAVHEAGLSEDHPFYQKALYFLQRCQQNTETNDLEKVRGEDGEVYTPGDDGGFIYHPGRGEAGIVKNADGTQSLRSYGSMTYAGFKSLLHAGVSKEDPRVQAALAWIREHYRLDANPGAGQQGLYYYYHTFAKALDAAGIDELTDGEGQSHNWRVDLAEAILSRQTKGGFWANESGRWMESNPVLATTYAVLALEYCLR